MVWREGGTLGGAGVGGEEQLVQGSLRGMRWHCDSLTVCSIMLPLMFCCNFFIHMYVYHDMLYTLLCTRTLAPMHARTSQQSNRGWFSKLSPWPPTVPPFPQHRECSTTCEKFQEYWWVGGDSRAQSSWYVDVDTLSSMYTHIPLTDIDSVIV